MVTDACETAAEAVAVMSAVDSADVCSVVTEALVDSDAAGGK